MDSKEEISHLEYILDDLKKLRDLGEISQEGYGYLAKRYTERILELKGLKEKEAPPPRPVLETAPPAPPRPQEVFSLEAFFTEHAISLLLYLGAFLVSIAALIYVGYNWETFSGLTKTFFIWFISLAFLILGEVFYQNKKLKKAGGVFIGIGSLMIPLAFVATYKFTLKDLGLSSPAMWLLGSLNCAVLYFFLGVKLPWKPYVYLSLTSLLGSNLALYELLGIRDPWHGVLLLVFSHFLLFGGAYFYSSEPRELLGIPFLVFSHGVALLSALSILLRLGEVPAASAYFVPFGMLLLFTFYLLQTAFYPARELVLLSGFSFLMLVISLGYVAQINREGYGLFMITSGLLFSLLAQFFSKSETVSKQDLHTLAAVLVFFAPFLMETNFLYVAAFFFAAAHFSWLSFVYKNPQLLYIAGYLFSAGYFRVYDILFGQPQSDWHKALFLFPVFFFLAGGSFYLRKRWHRNWAIPLYILSYFYALLMSLLSFDNKPLATFFFLVYAFYTYLIAKKEDKPTLVNLSSVWGALALWTTLSFFNIGTHLYPLFFSIYGISLYLLRFSHWPQTYRYLGLAYASATPILGAIQENSFQDFNSTSFVLILSLAILASLVYLDATVENSREQKYFSSFIAILTLLWFERFLGFENIQAYIIPLGTYFIILGSLLRLDHVLRTSREVINFFFGLGALVAMIPTYFMRYGTDGYLYTLLLGLEALIILFYGLSIRRKVLVVLGTSFTVLDVFSQLFDYLRALPSWVIIGITGIVLLTTAVFLLYKREEIVKTKYVLREKWQSWE